MLTTDKAHKAFQAKCGKAAVNHISLYSKGEKTLPRYNRSSNDIILTVTMNRLLIICAAHYAREKVSDLKMYKLIIRQEKTFMSLIWLIKLLKKKPGEEKMPVTVKDRWWCQSSPGRVRDDPFLDCTRHWGLWGWVHPPRLEMDWIHGSCWLHGWCIALPLFEVRCGRSAPAIFLQKRLALLLHPSPSCPVGRVA